MSPGGYDKELANGNPDYSKTTEPDGSGGYTERTYYTDANKIKQLVEIKKYNKAKVLTYFWMRYTDEKGNNVTEELTYPARGGVQEGTKTEVDKDGNTTTYTWDKDHWRFKSRTPKAASSGPRTTEKVLRSVASSIQIGVGVGGGGRDDEHHAGDKRRADEKLTRDEKRVGDNKVRTDDKLRTEKKSHMFDDGESASNRYGLGYRNSTLPPDTVEILKQALAREKRVGDHNVRTDDKLRTEEKSHTANDGRGGLRIKATDPEIVHDREAIDYHKKRKEMFERKLHGKPGPEEKKELEHHINVEEDTIRKYEADLARRGG